MRERHLSDDDLVLLHYGESDDVGADRVHLEACAACAEKAGRLAADLARVPAEDVPERPAGYGVAVAARLLEQLRKAGPARTLAFPRRRVPSHLPAWAALAASLTVAFWLGRQFPSAAQAPMVRERILLVAVGEHLARSRMVLAEIQNAPDGTTEPFRSGQEWAAELAAENRLYRQAAARSGDANVAGVLDEVGRVLAEVAHGPEAPDSRQLDELRARIEARGLIFKVKVEGQVRARAHQLSTRKESSS
jgi:hypothetical protein